MITNLQTVNSEKLKAQIAYLRDTPVSKFSDLLESGACVLKTGKITDIELIGNQMTFFGDLGGVFAKNIFNSDKFLVNQVWEILNRKDCDDSKSLEAVLGIKKALKAGILKPNITIFETETDMIIDGNKTATAFYELNKDNKNPINLDVFIILLA